MFGNKKKKRRMNDRVQSLNTAVDLVTEGTSHVGMNSYGRIMVGDHAFEFYDDRNPNNFVQIPWEEVQLVIASVYFKGKWIPRYGFQVKGHKSLLNFSSKDPKKVLRAVRVYIEPNRIVRSLTFFQVIKRGISSMFAKKNK